MLRPPGDRQFFLRNSAEIERVKKNGRRVQTSLFNLLACPLLATPSTEADAARHSRIGVVVGKRLGTAVVRNRAKRVFRELARGVRPSLVQGQALLVFPRRGALTVTHQQLRDTWQSALRREGLLVP
jgi:ribonuclease P protein component